MQTKSRAGASSGAPKSEEKAKEKNPYVIPIVIGILIFICIPYVYYAVQINAYLSENAPQDYSFVRYEHAWKTLAGAFATQCLRRLCHLTLPSFYYKYSKGGD